MFRAISNPRLHRCFVMARSVLVASLLVGACLPYGSTFFSEVPCPNVTTSYVDIAPPTEPEPPVKGALVMVGGGRIPVTIYDAILKRAGGPNARLVLITTAGSTAETEPAAKIIEPWLSRGFTHVSALHTQFRQRGQRSRLRAATQRGHRSLDARRRPETPDR